MPEAAQSPMDNPWKSLEGISPPVALPTIWRRWLGSDFEIFQRAFLQKRQDTAESFPCPYNCGCWHRLPLRINQAPPDTKLLILAACQCNPPHCPELSLTLEDVTPWELNWPSLASALRKAFGLNPKIATVGLPGTAQIGAWSPDAVPVILTIQIDPKQFRAVVAELAACVQKFILFAPTSQHMDANCQAILARSKTAFFSLDTTVRLTEHATLLPIKTPGELFANFTPQLGPQQQSSPFPPASPSRAPRYAIRKGLGLWKLTFAGQEADLRHEKGIFYVAWLLTHPPSQPIHGLDLITKIPAFYRKHLGLAEIVDPTTGKKACLQSDARLQERNLGLDDAQALRAILRKERELEAIIDDPDESEPIKAEALRELEALALFQKQNSQRTHNNAQRAVDSVRKAITRFHRSLLRSADNKANPILGQFAAHINQYLLIPSGRYSGPGGGRARIGLAGRFTYEPQPGVEWES
jgi:hypothetical protein